MSGSAGTSGRFVLPTPPSRQAVVWWSLAVSTGAVAAGVIYYVSKTAETYVPFQYQYRPGTISGWLAHALSQYSNRRKRQRPIRVYMDGCFDMMHYGHANALRQAKAAGDELVVGLIPDSEILRCKGPPVLCEAERHVLVDAVKWVDEIITGVPYDLSPQFVEELFTKHRVDYIVHGDDPCLLPDGTDAYAHAKKLGRFRMIKRTEGVSTTDIVGRMLTCTRNPFICSDDTHALAKSFSVGNGGHHDQDETSDSGGGSGRRGPNAAAVSRFMADLPEATAASSSSSTASPHLSRFMPTSRRLVQFSNGKVAPDGARIVYIDGAFDVFHPGHVKTLQAAKALGDFLLVGVHTDEDVSSRRGPHLPIMSIHERSLSVLACKFTDECIIGSPTTITDDLITTFNISVVVRGSVSETSHLDAVEEERYAVPKAKGIYHELSSASDMSARNIIRRIVDKREAYETRNAKKATSEAAYQTGKVAKGYVHEL